MATTGELRAIIEELELVDIGDAATYLGEEDVDVSLSTPQVTASAFVNSVGYVDFTGYSASASALADCSPCQG
jgi:hypothetical protein